MHFMNFSVQNINYYYSGMKPQRSKYVTQHIFLSRYFYQTKLSKKFNLSRLVFVHLPWLLKLDVNVNLRESKYYTYLLYILLHG